MGQVYLARDTRLQRSIALKIMQPEAEGEGSAQSASNGAARLLREAQSAAGLEHPNVVTIYEVGEIKGEGEEAGRPFIAMELVKGKALRAFVGDESVKMKERVRWLTDTARALAAAHRAGLIHRDIKPENVMVRDDGVVKVLDFGLAKRAASGAQSMSSSTEAQVLPSLTGKGIAIGTPYYMAPEQMRREPLDGRADQFAWGVVAYELLSGIPPWGREVDALELVSKLLSEDPTPLSEVRPDVPPHVAAAVTRAMSKRKGARFDTMDALIASLEDESGAFLPTMPRIAVSEPDLPDTPVVPTERLRSTVAVRPRAWGVRIAVGAAVVAASAFAIVAVSKRAGQKTSAPSASVAVAPHECAHNTECVAKLGGKPAVCNPSGKCAAIESQDCKAQYAADDLKRDDAVWLGAMYPLSGEDSSFGDVEARAFDLGREDFTSLAGAQLLSVRPLDVVLCNDATDPVRAAKHLADDLGVPAVVGFRSSNELMDLAGSLFIPRGLLTVAALNTSPLVTEVPQPPGTPRLVWRTTYNLADTAKPLALFVEQKIEPEVRAKTTGRPARVALVRMKTMGTLSLAHALVNELAFNGKSAIDNGSAFREIVVDESGGGVPNWSRAADELREFAPDIVLFQGGDDLIRNVVEPAEAAWSAHAGPRPVYVTMNVLAKEVFAFVGASADRRRRFFGMTTRSTTPANAHFVMHYNESNAQKITRSTSPNDSYDAFYFLAYAVYSLGGSPITGAALSGAFRRLVPPGTPIEVGPTDIFKALDVLRRGENIDLDGATGRLDFDLARGEAPVDFSVLCVDVDARGKAVATIESGIVYDSTRKALEGIAQCP